MDFFVRLKKAVGFILILGFLTVDLFCQSLNSVEGDRQSLMDLYETTDGTSWDNNCGWGNGNPSNSWHGVVVNAEGRVIRLDLYNNGLEGQLPESIGNLTKLRYLNLKNNRLSGEIPSSIGNMESLEWLILAGRTYDIGGHTKEPPSPEDLDVHAYHPGKHRSSTNNFSGTIPSTIGKLSNLLYLEISDQLNIKGPIPSSVGNLENLLGLYLNLNDFSGTSIPSTVGNLINLRHLFLADAQLEGNIPVSFSKLTRLTAINLGSSKNNLPGNNLTGDFPDFSEFTSLRHLWLSSNKLNGEWPQYWNNGNFTQLVTLAVSWNNLTGTLHGFENLPNLEHLGLGGNNMSGNIDEQLLTLPDRLQILALGWNNFIGELPQSGWPDFYKLKTIYLNDNNLTGEIPCDFWRKIDNPKLGIVWLKNNQFKSNCTSFMNSVKGKGKLNISMSGNTLKDLYETNLKSEKEGMGGNQ